MLHKRAYEINYLEFVIINDVDDMRIKIDINKYIIILDIPVLVATQVN